MKVLIADDHALFREGLRQLLRQLGDNMTILQAQNYKETLTLAAAHPDLDLMLVDLRMPDQDSMVALDTLIHQTEAVPVVVLSASEDPADIQQVLDAGVMGYIPKSEPGDVMLSAIRLVLSGNVYVPPALVKAAGIEMPNPDPLLSKLTARQLEVLGLILKGKSNKEIARELDLSDATVKVHVSAIFKALHVNNRTQAALVAEKLGLG